MSFSVLPAAAETAVLRFPVGLSPVLFCLFALLVVHICQRLVERAALAVEPLEQRAAFARTAVCVGSLVWALDAAGLLLYPELAGRDARLAPAILALVAMVLVARWTVPALTTTRQPLIVTLAAAGLALGMLLAHGLLMSAYGNWSGGLRWHFAGMALAIAMTLAVYLSLRHRAARLRAIQHQFRPLSWRDKGLAALVIVGLHWCLANVMPLQTLHATTTADSVAILLTLVLFAMLISADQIFNLHVDGIRQRLHNRALSLLRSMALPETVDGEQRLALIAERLPRLLGQLQLHYQPLVPQQNVDEPVRFEALLRVKDAELGALSPEWFFLACERCGQTGPADRAVLRRALQDAEIWRSPALGCAGVSVNIAPDTLLLPDFIDWLQAELSQRNCPPGWLQLEITEHAMIATAAPLAAVLRRLQVLGVAVAMDDFGAGFSSLGVLIDLPIQGIKCDRAFVRTLETDVARQVLLHHLCAMAHDLQLKVTIEGVETLAALDIVRSKGADTVQGYVFAKPMPAAEVPVWLCEYQHNAVAEVA